jgi:hypothetical protein
MVGKEKYAVVASTTVSFYPNSLTLSRPRRVDEIKIIPQPKKDRRRRLSEEGRKQQHVLVYYIQNKSSSCCCCCCYCCCGGGGRWVLQ